MRRRIRLAWVVRRHADERPIFFVHLQKTAGTALLFQFRQLFADDEIFPNQSDGDPLTVGPQFIPDRLREGWRARGDRLRVIIGHYPACLIDELGGRDAFTTMTLLRDPVERTLSLLRHHRVIHQDSGGDLEAIYADPFRFSGQIHNHMTKMLGMTSDEMGPSGMLTPLPCTPDHLSRAQERLVDMDLVGRQEEMNDFCALLRRRFGLVVDGRPRVNTTEAEPVPDSLRERIMADNELDMRLHEFARRL